MSLKIIPLRVLSFDVGSALVGVSLVDVELLLAWDGGKKGDLARILCEAGARASRIVGFQWVRRSLEHKASSRKGKCAACWRALGYRRIRAVHALGATPLPKTSIGSNSSVDTKLKMLSLGLRVSDFVRASMPLLCGSLPHVVLVERQIRYDMVGIELSLLSTIRSATDPRVPQFFMLLSSQIKTRGLEVEDHEPYEEGGEDGAESKEEATRKRAIQHTPSEAPPPKRSKGTRRAHAPQFGSNSKRKDKLKEAVMREAEAALRQASWTEMADRIVAMPQSHGKRDACDAFMQALQFPIQHCSPADLERIVHITEERPLSSLPDVPSPARILPSLPKRLRRTASDARSSSFKDIEGV
jgi:hypothetical protein